MRVLERPYRSNNRLIQQHPNLEWLEGDFANEQDLCRALHNVDAVFHLVSTTQPQSSNGDPIFDIQTNLIATIGLLEQMRSMPTIPLIFISSGGTVYGRPQQIPIVETHSTEPQCSYGIVKLAIEKYLALYHLLYGINYRVLRLANPYGPGQELNLAQGVIAAFISRIVDSQSLEVWGDGSVVRDYLYIGDAISALQKAALYQGEERIFNIGSGRGYSVCQIISSIENVSGKRADVRYSSKRTFDVPVNVLNIQRAQHELGWTPTTSLDEGLALTFEWMKKGPIGIDKS